MTILEFKNRKQQFEEWLKEVEKTNFKDQEVSSALFIWETPTNKEGYQATHCKFNCPLDQLKWFYKELGEYIKEREYDEYLRKHIHEYLEYI